MISTFPEYKKLELQDKEELERVTNLFPPYSDFNFVSLWSYNTEGDAEISNILGNISLKFRDYITNEFFYTFIGNNNVEVTIKKLLALAEEKKVLPFLKLVPESNFSNGPEILTTFNITEDRDNFDYIISTESMATLPGNEFGQQRTLINRFKRDNPECEASLLDLSLDKTRQDLESLFSVWSDNKNNTKEESEHELIAIQRLLKDAGSLKILAVGLYKDNKLIGFTLTEVLINSYSISHFTKADTSYKGIFQFLYQETGKQLLERGAKYLNREQDLGIPGLRQAKEQWNPVSFLKKYIISTKKD